VKQKYNAFLLLVILCFGFCPAEEPQVSRIAIPCLDGQSRVLGVYIPNKYSSKKPAPLFLWLHGGVNRPEKERGAEAVLFFSKEAEKAGIICAAPSGERGATWFDPVGYNNILSSLRYMLSNYSIDTTKIFIGGSSDGGTACYLLAMRRDVPQVNGFVICSGFPGVLEHSGIQFDVEKCKRHRWYIVHTGKDHLYPLDAVGRYISAMKKAGVSVIFRQYPLLPHGLDYADEERPLILKWIMKK
jgi:acetyl esterase/lipase